MRDPEPATDVGSTYELDDCVYNMDGTLLQMVQLTQVVLGQWL